MKGLPEDIDAERAILATCCAPGMDAKAAEVFAVVKPSDFSHPNHRLISKAVITCLQRSIEISPFSLLDVMGDKKSQLGGFQGLVDILQGYEVENPMVLADIIKSHRLRRDLIAIGNRLSSSAQDLGAEVKDVASKAAQEISDAASSRNAGTLRHVGMAVQEMQERQRQGVGRGVMTGFTQMDRKTLGFKPGQFILLGARPGIGKTALAMGWALNIAMAGGNVAIFSLEMGDDEIIGRMACNLAEVPRNLIKSGEVTEHQAMAYDNAVERINSSGIYINDSASSTLMDIQTQVSSLTARMKLDMVVVDYIGLVCHQAGKNASEAVRMGEISRAMKVLAKTYKVPVVALSQLNRNIENASDSRKPRLSDLRDSGSLEQDADIVMFLHRKAKVQIPGEPPDRTAELICAKHRDGEIFDIPMIFQGEFTRYIEDTYKER